MHVTGTALSPITQPVTRALRRRSSLSTDNTIAAETKQAVPGEQVGGSVNLLDGATVSITLQHLMNSLAAAAASSNLAVNLNSSTPEYLRSRSGPLGVSGGGGALGLSSAGSGGSGNGSGGGAVGRADRAAQAAAVVAAQHQQRNRATFLRWCMDQVLSLILLFCFPLMDGMLYDIQTSVNA